MQGYHVEMVNTDNNAATQFRMLVGGFGLLLITLVGIFLLLKYYPYKNYENILVAFGYGPIRGVYSVGDGSTKTERYVLDDYPGFYVTDIYEGDGHTYFMLAQLDVRATQVHKMGQGGELVQVTQSDTFKYDVSVDTDSNRVAYVSSEATTPQELIDNDMGTVVLFDENLGEETAIGIGKNPVLLKGGSQIVFETIEGLVTQTIGQASSTLLLPMENRKWRTVYAIDSQENKVALYRPENRTIEFYEIHDSGMQQKIDETLTISYNPQLITYVNGEVWASVLTNGTPGQEEVAFLKVGKGEFGEPLHRAQLSKDLNGYPLEIYSSHE